MLSLARNPCDRSVLKLSPPTLVPSTLLSLAISHGALSHARGVTRVTIEETGIVRPESDRNDKTLLDACSVFVPTQAQVIRYFAHAVPVPSIVTSHDRYTPCASTGTLTFADGFSGTWILCSDGSARIDWQAGGFVYLLYQPNRWRDPFAPYDQP